MLISAFLLLCQSSSISRVIGVYACLWRTHSSFRRRLLVPRPSVVRDELVEEDSPSGESVGYTLGTDL